MICRMHVLCMMVLPHSNGLLISFIGVVCCDGDLFARREFDWLIRVFEKPSSDFWPLQMPNGAMLQYVPEGQAKQARTIRQCCLPWYQA